MSRYRVQKIQFLDEAPIFIAQYRICRIWFNIGPNRLHWAMDHSTQSGNLLSAKIIIQRYIAIKKIRKKCDNWKITNYPYDENEKPFDIMWGS
jgi:hypothetical protein